MIIKIIFVRHAKTYGNKKRQYIGATDEDILDSEIKKLCIKKYGSPQIVFTSPMKRCIHTAEIIYPHKNKIIIDGICEYNFGDFEGKTYNELKNVLKYRQWIESCGSENTPNGENMKDFKNRCVSSFNQIINECINNHYNDIAIITHGGVIMAIMEHLTNENYYSWQIENGAKLVVNIDTNYMPNLQIINTKR